MYADGFFVFGEQRREDPTSGDVIPEFEPVANHFLETKMQSDGADLEIQRASHQHIAVTEVARRIDQSLGSREDGRCQRYLNQIVGQSDQSVAVHAPVGAKGEDIEQL